MRTLKGSAVVVLVLSLSAIEPGAQEVQIQQTIQVRPGEGPPVPFPGQGRQFKTGTGRIRGRLVAADSGTPVRRAQVRISGPDIMTRGAVTDAEGRYEFRDLPASRFNINATKPGFVSMSYGQLRPFESGKGIELTEGQLFDKADIAMPRGSAITGRILDEFGEPIADAQVAAMRSVWMNGRRRLQPSGRMVQTNDLGQYRIYGLAPGDYYVSATMRGGGAEMFMMETAAVAAAVMATPGVAGPAPSGSDPRAGYAPTYYPGTANTAEAQRIQLAAGQDVTAGDFSLLPVRLARVTGTVISSEGRPVEGAMVQSVPRSASEAAPIMFGPGGSSRTDRNGHFTLNGVAPGEYTVHVRGMQMMTSSGGDTVMFATRLGGGDGQTEFGSVAVSVGSEDVSNVMIVTSKGGTVTGRVVFEGDAKPPSGPTLRVAATAIDPEASMGGGMSSGPVTPDGTFEIKGVSGHRLLRPTTPAGWTLKSVTANGADVTDTGLNFKAGESVSGVEIVLTSKTTEVNGSVTAGSAPANDYTVVIFPEEPEKWTFAMNRHVASGRPNQQGRYQIKGLPAGSYYAIALSYIAQGEWSDPEVLARLKANATRFSLAEGEVQTLDLKLIGS